MNIDIYLSHKPRPTWVYKRDCIARDAHSQRSTILRRVVLRVRCCGCKCKCWCLDAVVLQCTALMAPLGSGCNKHSPAPRPSRDWRDVTEIYFPKHFWSLQISASSKLHHCRMRLWSLKCAVKDTKAEQRSRIEVSRYLSAALQ